VRPNPENLGYLTTKVEKLGHSIHLEGADATS